MNPYADLGDLPGLVAPFPYFGAKAAIADVVWERLGDVQNYVEPLFGSGAVLLGRPASHVNRLETVNDKDGHICNFWRAIRADSKSVAEYADWPSNENDLHARHIWLVNRKDSIVSQLEGDPDWYDAKIAGWWLWGICCWLGSGWCSGNGPWQSIDGKLVKTVNDGMGVRRQRLQLGDAGQGVHRKLLQLNNAGQGVHRKLLHLGNAGMGVHSQKGEHLIEWFSALQARLRRVRVCCGDWARITGPTVTFKHGVTGVFLDPPYSLGEREGDLYSHDEADLAASVAAWAVKNGDNPLMRIALCGYEGEHQIPDSWTAHRWKAAAGYGVQGEGRGKTNRFRETIWFSPHCLAAKQARMDGMS